MTRRVCAAAILLVLTLFAIPLAPSAQSRQPFRIQVHAGGDPMLRERVVSGVSSALKPVVDVEVVSRDPDYVVSVIVLPAIDVGLVTTWNMTVGRKNEKLAAIGLWSMAAFRTYLAINNIRNQSRAARR